MCLFDNKNAFEKQKVWHAVPYPSDAQLPFATTD
jgi:hypothetical protein